jgi:hypothetical protein
MVHLHTVIYASIENVLPVRITSLVIVAFVEDQQTDKVRPIVLVKPDSVELMKTVYVELVTQIVIPVMWEIRLIIETVHNVQTQYSI